MMLHENRVRWSTRTVPAVVARRIVEEVLTEAAILGDPTVAAHAAAELEARRAARADAQRAAYVDVGRGLALAVDRVRDAVQVVTNAYRPLFEGLAEGLAREEGRP